VEAQDTSPHYKRCARFDIAGALTSQGIAFADLTAEAFLHYATETRLNRFGNGYELYVGHLAWKVLHQSGHFPPGVPATLRGALRAPAMTPAELVAQHSIRNPHARQMLTAYLTRRSHDIDYTTLRQLATDLCGNFWAEIERINPEQNDLALSEETYQAWRVALGTRQDGKPRLGADAIVTNVRALYLDIQGWAIQEPEKWARWSATCPISSRDIKARAKTRRRTKERMDNRTRILQPLLPVLVAAVEQRRDHMTRLLSAATTAHAGQAITIDNRRYTRVFLRRRRPASTHPRLAQRPGPRRADPPRDQRHPCRGHRVLGMGLRRNPAPHRCPQRRGARTLAAEHPPIRPAQR
jgi:hypothetical protein